MLAPILHIRTETEVDVAERCVSIVAGAAQKGILSVDFLREKHTISIEWKKGILTLIEGFEVESIANSYRRSMVTIAPSNPITVLNPCYSRVIFIF